MSVTSDTAGSWPQKSRDIFNHHMDSTIWDDFAFRDDDIVIATYAKSGTTWVQQIVGQLLFHGAEEVPVADMSPWLDLRVPPKEVKLPAVMGADATAASSRPTCRWTRSSTRHRQSTFISGATGVTWSGACTTTTPTPMNSGTRR